MNKMTKQEVSQKLMESMKAETIEHGINVSDTRFELGVEDEVGVGFKVIGAYAGYENAIIQTAVAALMLDDEKAKVFIDTVNAMADPENNINLDGIDELDTSFLIDISLGEDFTPEFTLNTFNPEGLGCALQALHEKEGEEETMSFVKVLVGIRDKYEDGLTLTGDRDPSITDAIKLIMETMAASENKEEESK